MVIACDMAFWVCFLLLEGGVCLWFAILCFLSASFVCQMVIYHTNACNVHFFSPWAEIGIWNVVFNAFSVRMSMLWI